MDIDATAARSRRTCAGATAGTWCASSGPPSTWCAAGRSRAFRSRSRMQGIDRYVDRARTPEGRAGAPIRIEFCEADVLDAFDAWRRAVGVHRAESEAGEAEDGGRHGSRHGRGRRRRRASAQARIALDASRPCHRPADVAADRRGAGGVGRGPRASSCARSTPCTRRRGARGRRARPHPRRARRARREPAGAGEGRRRRGAACRGRA